MFKNIKCRIEPNSVLVPDPNGSELAIVSIIAATKENTKCGTINFAGKVQAFITFDLTGTIVVGYTLTELGPNAFFTELSVKNIIPFI